MTAAAAGRRWGGLRNPIFARELLTTLRRPRSYALLGLSLLVSAGVVGWQWPSELTVGHGATARALFDLFARAQVVVAGLLVPGLLGAALTAEKEGGTYDLLLTTPLRPATIVAGKLLSGLGFLALLALASAPALLLCSAIGGLSARSVLALYGALAAQAVAFGLTSLACSAWGHKTLRAVMLAYLLVALEAAVLSALSDPTDLALAAALVGGVAFLVACAGLRRPHEPGVAPTEPEPERATGLLVLDPEAFPDRLLLPVRRGVLLRDDDDPVQHKELHAGIHGAGTRFVRALIQLGVVLGLVVFVAGLGGEPTRCWSLYGAFAAGFAMTLGPAMGARAFSGEREDGTAEMLCLVLLPRWRIVRGKFLAYFRVVAALTAIDCAVFFFAALGLSLDGRLGRGVLLNAAGLACVIASASAVSVALGLLCSLWSRTTISAMLRAYGILLAAWVAPALVAAFASPPAWAGVVLRTLSPLLAGDLGGSLGLRGSWTPLLGLAGHLALSALVTAWALRACARSFDACMAAATGRT